MLKLECSEETINFSAKTVKSAPNCDLRVCVKKFYVQVKQKSGKKF